MIKAESRKYPWSDDSDVVMFFDPAVLITYVNDCFYAEQEYRLFIKSRVPGWWLNKTAQEREDYTKYNERNDYMWCALADMCRMLSIDQNRLLTIVKSLNRYEKNHGKYDRCAHIDENKFLKAIQKPDAGETQHFKSTGRRDKSREGD